MVKGAPPALADKGRISSRAMLIGVATGIGAGLSYGVAQVMGRYVTTELAPAQVAVVYNVAFGILGMGIVAARHLPRDIKGPRRSLVFISLSGFAGSVGLLFLYLALSVAPISLVSPVAAVVPLFSLVMSYIFLRSIERVTLRTVLGALAVVAGVVLIVIGG